MSAAGDFERCVREAQIWCDRQINLSGGSSRLRPARFSRAAVTASAVASLVSARRQELVSEPAPVISYLGRMLVYFPDQNLADGAAKAESRGFFDVDNAPPPGTWIHYFDHAAFLLAWVPRDFLTLAEAGIDANPERCISWLKSAPWEARREVARWCSTDGETRARLSGW